MQLYAPSTLTKGIKGDFIRAITGIASSSYVPMMATVVPSGARSETYAWLGESPQMKEVIDEVEFSDLSDTNYSITNTLFAAGMRISRNDIADDQIGAIKQRIQRLAMVAGGHKNKLLIDALINGDVAGNVSYDGNVFFSATHPARGLSGQQSNLYTQSGVTTAAVSTDLNGAIAQMAGLLAENGENFFDNNGGINKLLVIAPVAMRKPVLEALRSQLVSNTSNVQWEGLDIQPLFVPRLDTDETSDLYLMNSGMLTRPLILQDRDPLEFTFLTNGDIAFVREQYLAKVRARYQVGYAFWQGLIKISNP